MVSTKIEMSHNKIARIKDLDELALVLFPGNRNHQKTFVAIFIELKWSESKFLSVLEPIAEKYGISRRVLETVRAKMRRLGLIDHVSRFNRRYGYREGWVFSNKFYKALTQLAGLSVELREKRGSLQKKKEQDMVGYL